MSELKNAISTNEKLKLDINNRLQKNRKQADALRQELATRANSHERRTLMELEYRVLKVSFCFNLTATFFIKISNTGRCSYTTIISLSISA